ncbi:MAG: hypothetical protein L6R40_003712 [Gallowayella cf. fulva]|nr:MAG: hypothetical protein L6R40_003712 [Xanthomendoza cf. fulva]
MQFKQALIAAFAMATLTIAAPVDHAASKAEVTEGHVATAADPGAAEGAGHNSYYGGYGGAEDLEERSVSVKGKVEAKHHAPYATNHLDERSVSVKGKVEAKHHAPYATNHLDKRATGEAKIYNDYATYDLEERADQSTVESKHHSGYERDVQGTVESKHHSGYERSVNGKGKNVPRSF